MNTSKEDLQKSIEGLSKEDLDREFEEISRDPTKFNKELDEMTKGMTEKDMQAGVDKYGSAEGFVNALVTCIAFKFALIRKGLAVGLAGSAAAVVLFGTGSLCHAVAGATSIAAIDEIGGIADALGELSLDVSDFGLEVASESAGILGDLLDGAMSLFS